MSRHKRKASSHWRSNGTPKAGLTKAQAQEEVERRAAYPTMEPMLMYYCGKCGLFHLARDD